MAELDGDGVVLLGGTQQFITVRPEACRQARKGFLNICSPDKTQS